LVQLGLCEEKKPEEVSSEEIHDDASETQKENIQEEKVVEDGDEVLSEEEDEAEYYAQKYRNFLFYSIEQFQELILCIEPLPNCEFNYSKLYIDTMNPVPKWMEMAKSIWPMEKEIWMSSETEDIERTTEKLINSRRHLLDYWKVALHGIDCWSRLPGELVEIIAEYSVPCTSDVRLAWWDDVTWSRRKHAWIFLS
jgi:hypothetical protein